MSYATIYDMTTAYTISDGVQSATACDAAIQMARREARDLGHSVIVEDRGTRECYRVTPRGHIWRAPKSWPAPVWEDGEYD